MEGSDLEHVGPLVQSLLGHISELVAATDIADSNCGELLAATETLRALASSPHPPQLQLAEAVACLGKAFTNIVDHLLAQQIKVKHQLRCSHCYRVVPLINSVTYYILAKIIINLC